MAPRPAARTQFGGTTPICALVTSASVDYYVNVLGFSIDFEDVIASVGRDRRHLFLVPGDQGHPGTWVWIGVQDADALHEEYRATGAKIRQPPTNFAWAREMQVEDLDGNVLRLGSEPRPNQPFGPWLDMHGDRWVLQPGGDWRRVERSE